MNNNPNTQAIRDNDASSEPGMEAAFIERVRANQQKLTARLKQHYDFIVCGSGSSGSVVARRLAENPDADVLLLEAGDSDDFPNVTDPSQWQTNLGSERDWAFVTQPNPHLNGRAIPLSAGKVLGGGSGINVMMWARGHKSDWDFFASESGDAAWSYESVLGIYRRTRRLARGGAHAVGIPTFEHQNGRMMEGDGGASLMDLRVRDGQRLSLFRSYTFLYMDRPNLTVLTHAFVTRVLLEGGRASGVEFVHHGRTQRVGAGLEVVLSLCTVHTPKVLMLSGIGDRSEPRRLGIPRVQHLAGVGRNSQDHVAICCIWQSPHVLTPHNSASDATYLWKSDPRLATPDLQTLLGEAPICSAEARAQFNPPAASWTMLQAS
jgi:choline dehydrogenase-like flavoprotein